MHHRSPAFLNLLFLLLPVSWIGFAQARPAGGQPLEVPNFSDELLKNRVEFWLRQLVLAKDPEGVDQISRNLIALGPPAVPFVINIAQKDRPQDAFFHWNICLMLGKMENPVSIPYLLDRLKPVPEPMLKQRPEWTYSRAYAALALGLLTEAVRDARPRLEEILLDRSESSFLRRAVAFALGKLGKEESIEVLNTIMVNPQEMERLRGAAALGLGFIASDRSTEKLLAYLELASGTRHPMVDRMVVQSLGHQRKPGNGGPLIPFMDANPDPDLKGTTALVLAWLGMRDARGDIKALLEEEKLPVFSRCNAAVALATMDEPKQSADFLMGVIFNEKQNAGTRAYATVALAEFKDDETLKALHRAATTIKDPVIVLNAVNALGHRRDQRMIDFLIGFFGQRSGRQDEFIRGEIVRALLSHPPKESIRVLFKNGLKDPSAYVRKNCAIALARYPGGDTEITLMGVLSDKDLEVRGEAALTLGVLKAKRAIPELQKLLEDNSDWVRVRALKSLQNIVKYGDSEFAQVKGMRAMVDRRLFRVGGSLKDEMDRLYTTAYSELLSFDQKYIPNERVR